MFVSGFTVSRLLLIFYFMSVDASFSIKDLFGPRHCVLAVCRRCDEWFPRHVNDRDRTARGAWDYRRLRSLVPTAWMLLVFLRCFFEMEWFVVPYVASVFCFLWFLWSFGLRGCVVLCLVGLLGCWCSCYWVLGSLRSLFFLCWFGF